MKLRSGARINPSARPSDVDITKNGVGFVERLRSLPQPDLVLTVHLLVALYSMSFWISNTILPFLGKQVGINDPQNFGYLQTVFALGQLIGSPLFGRLGDLYGSRIALCIAFGSSAVSYGLLAISSSMWMLYASRIVSILMHVVQGGQMVMTDISSDEGRTDAIGKIMMSYGIGMVIGPILAGQISKIAGEHMAALVAALISAGCVFITMARVPASTKNYTPDKKDSEGKHVEGAPEPTGMALLDVKKIATLCCHPLCASLLLIKILHGFPIGMWQAMFSVFALEKFGIESQSLGLLLSYVGVLTMISQAFVAGLLLKKFNEFSLLKLASFVLIWSYLLLAFVDHLWQFYVVLVPLCVALSIANLVITSTLTSTVDVADTGAVLGISMGINSCIRCTAPVLGGMMMAAYGPSSFGILGAVVGVFATGYLMVNLGQWQPVTREKRD